MGGPIEADVGDYEMTKIALVKKSRLDQLTASVFFYFFLTDESTTSKLKPHSEFKAWLYRQAFLEP